VTTSETSALAGQDDGGLARAIAGPEGGRAAAEAELYRRFAPRVRLYGLRHLRDRNAVDDLVQQVMLVVIERLRAGEVRDADQIGSFILGTSRLIAGNLARTMRRRDALQQRFTPRGDDAVWMSESALDLPRVTGCLEAVRERERTILLLTFYAERSSSDIARAMGMTSGAVRVARHRALEAMRGCLESRRVA
jgi:RNA polymerase sigma-70 factor (ECF subfamily)